MLGVYSISIKFATPSFVIGFSMYLIGGIIFGLILWKVSERNK